MNTLGFVNMYPKQAIKKNGMFSKSLRWALQKLKNNFGITLIICLKRLDTCLLNRSISTSSYFTLYFLFSFASSGFATTWKYKVVFEYDYFSNIYIHIAIVIQMEQLSRQLPLKLYRLNILYDLCAIHAIYNMYSITM